MKKTIITFILAALVNLLHAQTPLVKQWDYRFGGTGGDIFTCFQQTRDGGYILGGASGSGISGDKSGLQWGGRDYWIVKIDSLGHKQWDKDFGGTGVEYLSSIQQTYDGGYILGGYSYSGISGDKSQATWGNYDYWIVKTDSLGIKQWDKDFGGTGLEYLNSIQQTADGGYLLGGLSQSGVSGNKTTPNWGIGDYWIVKTDSLGIWQWDKDFGGIDNDAAISIQQTADGGYILAGNSESDIGGNKTQAGWGYADWWIVKTDALGSIQWDRDFGGTSSEQCTFIQQTADGGYIFGGSSVSGTSGNKSQATYGDYDYWIVKTNSLGIKQWDKDFGGTNMDILSKVSQTNDGGYLISGFSQSPISGVKTESNLGPAQTWVVKTDSLGNKQWDKTIFNAGQVYISFAIQTKDGCYAIADGNTGGISGYKSQASQGLDDYWIIKFCETNLTLADFVSSSTLSICNDTCIDFFSASSNATSYQWSFPGATPSTDTTIDPQYICYSTPGQYDVTLIITNNTTSDTITLNNYITVYPRPVTPVITQIGDTLFTFQNYATYQWYRDTLPITGATNYFYVATQNGNYYVNATDSNGCNISAAIINVMTGVELTNSNSEFIMLPNPTTNIFTIKNISIDQTLVEIINVFGEVVHSEKLFGKNECLIDGYFARGIYFVRVSGDEKNIVRKLIVE